MSNVVYLPDPMLRQWDSFANTLCNQLEEEATLSELKDLLQRLKPVFLEHATKLTGGPASSENILEELNKWVTQLVGGLLLDLALRELELIRAGIAPPRRELA